MGSGDVESDLVDACGFRVGEDGFFLLSGIRGLRKDLSKVGFYGDSFFNICKNTIMLQLLSRTCNFLFDM